MYSRPHQGRLSFPREGDPGGFLSCPPVFLILYHIIIRRLSLLGDGGPCAYISRPHQGRLSFPQERGPGSRGSPSLRPCVPNPIFLSFLGEGGPCEFKTTPGSLSFLRGGGPGDPLACTPTPSFRPHQGRLSFIGEGGPRSFYFQVINYITLW